MQIKSSKLKINTHHYGFLDYSSDKNICIPSISKCGSTSLRMNLNLNKKIRFEDYKKEYYGEVYAFIRDPIERFKSGLVETLARFYYDNFDGNVEVC